MKIAISLYITFRRKRELNSIDLDSSLHVLDKSALYSSPHTFFVGWVLGSQRLPSSQPTEWASRQWRLAVLKIY
ncbi:MAG: hypothetical protein ACJ8DI_28810 [Ktedonobacteraceae bacterium]